MFNSVGYHGGIFLSDLTILITINYILGSAIRMLTKMVKERNTTQEINLSISEMDIESIQARVMQSFNIKRFLK